MPCSLSAYRIRIGLFGRSLTANKSRFKSVFSPSFICFVLYTFLNRLHPLKIFALFGSSLLVSLTLLGIFLFVLVLASLLLGHFLFSICSRIYVDKRANHPLFFSFLELSLFAFIESTIIRLLLVSIGNIERNPGPNNNLKFATWNLDSLLTRDGIKKSLIEGLDSHHKFDVFGVCESYLTKNNTDDDIFISGFAEKPFRADCKNVPEDARPRGGVCLYFKECLPIVNRKDLVLTDETIISEITLGRKKIFHVLSYRTPSMTTVGDVAAYCSNLKDCFDKIARENPSLVILTGDFNARSPVFWSDERVENMPGEKLDNFMLLSCL